MNAVQQTILFAIGCLSLLLGIGLMVWASVQKRSAAGPKLKEISALLKTIASLMDAIGRTIPNAAARVGFILALLGVFLIVLPIWLPH